MASPSLPKTRFKHLLCDLDGTLIYSGDARVHLEFIGRTLPGLKKHQGWRAAIRALTEGQAILKIPSAIETNFDRLVGVFEKNLKLTREKAIEEMGLSVGSVFPKLKGHFGEMKGAAAFVDWAKSHYTLTVATNPVWSLELVKLRMSWGGINPELFGSVTTADRMHACKPSKEYYHEILSQENFKAEDCLMVGNERGMDLPATKVGIAVFLIRLNAPEMTCIEEPGPNSPGAWRGTYQHLRELLEKNAKI